MSKESVLKELKEFAADETCGVTSRQVELLGKALFRDEVKAPQRLTKEAPPVKDNSKLLVAALTVAVITSTVLDIIQ